MMTHIHLLKIPAVLDKEYHNNLYLHLNSAQEEDRMNQNMKFQINI